MPKRNNMENLGASEELQLQGFFVAYMRHHREADAANFKRFIQKWQRWVRSYEGDHSGINPQLKLTPGYRNSARIAKHY